MVKRKWTALPNRTPRRGVLFFYWELGVIWRLLYNLPPTWMKNFSGWVNRFGQDGQGR
jgi:hypothetical protein